MNVECKEISGGICKAGHTSCFPIKWGLSCPRLENSILEHFNPADSIAIIWNVEDVKQAMRDFQVEAENVTDEKLMDVLEEVSDSHDANFGVNWETLATTAEVILREEN